MLYFLLSIWLPNIDQGREQFSGGRGNAVYVEVRVLLEREESRGMNLVRVIPDKKQGLL